MTKIFMSILVFILPGVLMAAPISAENVKCTAKYFEVLPDGNARKAESVLKVTDDSTAHLLLETELEGRGYVFNGPKKNGPYMLTISKAPDYTFGSNTTGEFSAEGRLQVSVVEGNIVHKLECYRR
ncbi:hypothetical protein AZI86_15705 [Bdellovibrio bacteriovorus]|uniref:Carboxypeptidase regulatory-like domain-containing protein n=1 Tax=Bdellovibrio bacteriovorus TaxID=959 RepID=A0A150WHG8_BDEBC|nr:hypothetical protein [Bdellovibrio bacteriovorus]KYG63151.1 hypothetical protein AZI86_15705 [Bdellovibrio bacteriovorus]